MDSFGIPLKLWLQSLLRFVWVGCAMLGAQAAQATCTGDLPQTGLMPVYGDATSGAVIGGISRNQCGLEVTDFCENGRCLTFFDGLSGYVDVSGLASGTIAEPPSVFEYRVDAVDGSLTFMGREQGFDLNSDEPILVTPAADHVLLSLPDPLPKNIRMTSTGASGWEATLPDWVGVPIPVSLYLDRVSAPRATLEVLADHQMLTMDMRLVLARMGGPASVVAGYGGPDPILDETSDCSRTRALAAAVGEAGDQDQINAFYASVQAVGITNWDSRSAQQCADLLQQLARAGIPGVSDADPGNTTVAPPASCDALVDDLRPILRGPQSPEKDAILAALVSMGVSSIDPTNPKNCSEIAAILER